MNELTLNIFKWCFRVGLGLDMVFFFVGLYLHAWLAVVLAVPTAILALVGLSIISELEREL